MPRDVWSVVIAPNALRELVAQPMDPLDRVTLADRVREVVRLLIRSRGRPRDAEPADPYTPGSVRLVSDRLEAVFTVGTRRQRSWRRFWRVRLEGRITVLSLYLFPLREGG